MNLGAEGKEKTGPCFCGKWEKSSPRRKVSRAIRKIGKGIK